MGDTYKLRPWSEIVRLHPDVESGAASVTTYAIDLGALVINDPNVPAVYRDADSFFRATYLTPEMTRLISDVISCLAGGQADRVIQLRSPFGGGKSHTLAALYHAAKNPESLKYAPELKGIFSPGKIAVVVFDGGKFDAVVGKDTADGRHLRTMWGWLAWQLSKELGDPEIFQSLEKHDEERVSPGGDEVAKLLARQPTLILLDEVLKYMVRASGVRVEATNLQQLSADFLDTLVREVA